MVSLLTDKIYDLNMGVAFAIDRAHDRTVRCVEAHLWLTQEGLVEDIILAPGECYKIKSKGRVVMEALTGKSRFVISASTGWVSRFIRSLRGLRVFSGQQSCEVR